MKSESNNQSWDVFISYASEDRESVAEPLAIELKKLGVTVWYDRTELKLGDSVRQKIDDGLSKCRFGVVILSKAFFAKHYTNLELNGLAQREANGQQVIIPIWHQVTLDEIRYHSPTLADRHAANWEAGMLDVVVRILDKARPDIVEQILRKFSPADLIPRLTSGSEIVAIIHGAHLSNCINDDPKSPEELSMVSEFMSEVHDLGIVLDDMDPGDRIRIEYQLAEQVDHIEDAGWAIHGRKVRRKLKIGGVEDNWTMAVIALIRGHNKQVYSLGDQVVVSEIDISK